MCYEEKNNEYKDNNNNYNEYGVEEMSIFQIKKELIDNKRKTQKYFSIGEFIMNHGFEAYRDQSRIGMERFDETQKSHYIVCCLKIKKQVNIHFYDSNMAAIINNKLKSKQINKLNANDYNYGSKDLELELEGIIEDTAGMKANNKEKDKDKQAIFERNSACLTTTVSSFDKISTLCDFIMQFTLDNDNRNSNTALDIMDIGLYSQRLNTAFRCNDFVEVLIHLLPPKDNIIELNFMYCPFDFELFVIWFV